MIKKRPDRPKVPLSQKKAALRRRLKNQRIVVIAIGVIIGLPSLFFAIDSLIHWGRIHHGVTVNGINVGNLNPSDAADRLSVELKKPLGLPLTLSYKKQNWKIHPGELDVKINVRKSADRAFQVGRSEPFLQRFKTHFVSWFKPVKLNLVYSVDKKSLEDVVDKISDEIYKPPLDATIQIEGTSTAIAPSQIGLAVNKAQLISLVMQNIVSVNHREIVLPITIVPVKITEKEAQPALKETRLMISRPVNLKYNQNVWTLSETQIASLIRFEIVEKKAKGKKGTRVGYLLEAKLDEEKTSLLIDDLTKDVRLEPKNAQFKVSGSSVTIVPSQNGLAVDSASAYQDLSEATHSTNARDVILTSKVLLPELTTEKANAMGIKQRVSTFTTDYNPAQTSRVSNIHLLADALDGAIVPPDGIFSFNERVGPRTAEKGYQEAPTIVQGELTMTVGGGVCQVGTTIFNSVFFGGYPIVERHNHSFYISHYPAGRDATVSYGSLDFKFKNNTSAYILIKAWYSASTLTISLYSTNFGNEVSYTTSEFSNFVPFPIKYIDDPALPKGTQTVEDEGVDGRDVTVNRTVKRGGVVIVQDKFFSRYKPKKATIRNGTAEVPPPTTETTPTP